MALWQGFRWDRWAEGLINTTLGGVVSTAVGYAASAADGHPLDWTVIWKMLVAVAVWNFLSYVKAHPPQAVVEETEKKTTVTPSSVTQTETKTTTTTDLPPEK